MGVSTPVTMNGTSFDPQNLADRIFVAVNLVRGGLADHANLVRAAHVLVGERRAFGQRPLADVEIVRPIRRECG